MIGVQLKATATKDHPRGRLYVGNCNANGRCTRLPRQLILEEQQKERDHDEQEDRRSDQARIPLRFKF
jgi:hypothetical protein